MPLHPFAAGFLGTRVCARAWLVGTCLTAPFPFFFAVPEHPGAVLRRPLARRGRRGPVGGGLHPAGAPPGLGPGRLLSPGAPPATRLLPGALQQSHLQEPARQSLPQRGLFRLLLAAPGRGRGKSVGVRRGGKGSVDRGREKPAKGIGKA